ncbi:MAG: nuclease-related domain-containing protein [Propionibacteriaceae bacterium]|nr:nuclease-related domain-containing protein [Propionibacteriaceae bacterium]
MIEYGKAGQSARAMHQAKLRAHEASEQQVMDDLALMQPGTQRLTLRDQVTHAQSNLFHTVDAPTDWALLRRRFVLAWAGYVVIAVVVSLLTGQGSVPARVFGGVMHTVWVGSLIIGVGVWATRNLRRGPQRVEADVARWSRDWIESRESREASPSPATPRPQSRVNPSTVPWDVERWRVGAEAEERTARILSTLPDTWACWHDVTVAGQAMNVDHLLQGPPGAVVVDTKAWSGQVTVDQSGRLVGDGTFDPAGSVRTIEHEIDTLVHEAGEEADFPFWNEINVSWTVVIAVHGARAGMPPAQLSGRHPTWLVDANDLPRFLQSLAPGRCEGFDKVREVMGHDTPAVPDNGDGGEE